MNERLDSVWAVVPAAGIGQRMAAGLPKQYLEIDGRPVLQRTLERLAAHARIEQIVVAIAADDDRYAALKAQLPAKCQAVVGGAERCHSVLAGLRHLTAIAAASDWVLVHDAARPCVRLTDIDNMLNQLDASASGGILAVPVRDTLKRVDEQNSVTATVDRRALWHALTPQVFRLGALKHAIEAALSAGDIVTDEAQAMERSGHAPVIVAGHSDNLKITHPEDLQLASIILQAQAQTLQGEQD